MLKVLFYLFPCCLKKNLWHVEKAFRIAKSDLEARPIFHQKRDSIKAHIPFLSVYVWQKQLSLRLDAPSKKSKTSFGLSWTLSLLTR
ncbi:MAG: hypothetical protein A3E68_00600 [Candidatus Levybacteria bacterium RIFCSPHIGHO2_12_FULL_39_39]|nr:MAG: hypothetical protein A2689_02600 [Candidatus Levybacteria bacterium RIFCSPHIGHO2_01_FULL_38_96]OGH25617.1 MAG: hypothetical protein A3E68_00600 [Candidatus Levybacteria bacterium RIFCSPHIGHO2_12_FULL_39_39]OGH36239.1 MAG: hypothetical protein A3B43_00135 [Candidatus Levybacteria bacterium RIFCSPLOWO2_01_FULL_38_120]